MKLSYIVPKEVKVLLVTQYHKESRIFYVVTLIRKDTQKREVALTYWFGLN
ncbi:MAG: hypothetical protein WCW65_01115 [Candidatus Paceibacterota bacterium]